MAVITLAFCFPMLLGIFLVMGATAGSPVLLVDTIPLSEGTSFRRYRFRTTGPGGDAFKALGRFLRRCDLDELPDLWNVARGKRKLRDVLWPSRGW